jgi:carbonyl reductase 1
MDRIAVVTGASRGIGLEVARQLVRGALGRQLAADERRILVHAADPGWVRTGMGGPNAPRSVEEGADMPMWLALLPEGGPQAGFCRRRPAAW